MTKKSIVTCADLFCGAGGFSLGALLAGCKPLIAVDVDYVLSSAYELNFPSTKVVRADLSKVEMVAMAKRASLEPGSVPIVIGGPPCQGFSEIGKRNPEDPRNALTLHFFRHVAALRPRAFVLENVPGILRGGLVAPVKQGLDLVSNRYEIIGPLELDAANFGAATRRSRIVLIGYDRRYVDSFDQDDVSELANRRPATVRDAISDLPAPRTGVTREFGFDWLKYRTEELDELSRYARRARRVPARGTGSEISVAKLREGRVSGGETTRHAPDIVNRFRRTPPGRRDGIARFPRLEWDKPCSTLRAGTGPERGSYQSVRPIHPDRPRVITVREAARLQGFPDWFLFHPSKWHSFRMIGNSVSPFLASALLKFICARLQ